MRRAHVTGARSEREVAAYMPGNYVVMGSMQVDGRLTVIIEGADLAGWTLDGYVIPRLASGLMGCAEVAIYEAPEVGMTAGEEWDATS